MCIRDSYKREPDAKTIQMYDDDFLNILFVGRVAPHKKQEDIIRAFCYYNRNINKKSRLFLVGSDGGDVYKRQGCICRHQSGI